MFINKIALDLITKYKEKTEYKPHTCKYLPTCSTYARQCFTEYNFLTATILTSFRILRCNPLTKPKVNPIPKYKGVDIYLYENNLTIRSVKGTNKLVVKYYDKVVNEVDLTTKELKNDNYKTEILKLLANLKKVA